MPLEQVKKPTVSQVATRLLNFVSSAYNELTEQGKWCLKVRLGLLLVVIALLWLMDVFVFVPRDIKIQCSRGSEGSEELYTMCIHSKGL